MCRSRIVETEFVSKNSPRFVAMFNLNYPIIRVRAVYVSFFFAYIFDEGYEMTIGDVIAVLHGIEVVY